MIDFSSVDSTPINNIAIDLAIIIAITIIVTSIFSVLLTMLRVPRGIVNSILGLVNLGVFCGTFYLLSQFGLLRTSQ
ncbi:MAG: hypothetical protein K0S34_1326 [Bacillales bacterium]|jgi:hypothetical protein|nr:hypothetical protein [Bacillales bacterium]